MLGDRAALCVAGRYLVRRGRTDGVVLWSARGSRSGTGALLRARAGAYGALGLRALLIQWSVVSGQWLFHWPLNTSTAGPVMYTC